MNPTDIAAYVALAVSLAKVLYDTAARVRKDRQDGTAFTIAGYQTLINQLQAQLVEATRDLRKKDDEQQLRLEELVRKNHECELREASLRGEVQRLQEAVERHQKANTDHNRRMDEALKQALANRGAKAESPHESHPDAPNPE